MAAIKRSTAEALRNEAQVGRKVMLMWDKACIDYRHWFSLKHTYGIYFTTCEKSNSTAEICSVNMLDLLEPRNAFINSALTRATQRTQRFIRWVLVRLCLDVPWSESLARLREIWILPAQ